MLLLALIETFLLATIENFFPGPIGTFLLGGAGLRLSSNRVVSPSSSSSDLVDIQIDFTKLYTSYQAGLMVLIRVVELIFKNLRSSVAEDLSEGSVLIMASISGLSISWARPGTRVHHPTVHISARS